MNAGREQRAPFTLPWKRLSDSHITKSDSASTGYRRAALEPTNAVMIEPSDSDDSHFFVFRVGGAKQMCEYDSLEKGRVGVGIKRHT